MSLQLVIPGLVWPATKTAELTTGLVLPALQTLLGHARVHAAPAMSAESWLGQAFGLTGELPHAALRRLGEADASAVDGEWLCADPVHLHFAREHMLLMDASALELGGQEAEALVAALNDFLAEVDPGLGRFESGSPERWYLRLSAPARSRFFPLNDVVGRPIKHFLPEGEEARRWQRLANEAQIVLHNHPINQAREAAGKRTVNSIWFWGPGALPPRVSAPARAIQAESPLARGLARAAGHEPSPPSPRAGEDTLVFLEALLQPSLHLDIDRWRAALQRLETEWFAPLLEALKVRRLSSLTIVAPGDRATLELRLNATGLWKFWQRPRTLDSLLCTLP